MKMISVIIPAFNVEKYIKKCLNSVLNQRFSDIEIIVVNDGSIDNTAKVVDELIIRDSRIQLINSINLGVTGARKLGLEKAQGEYVCFVDADDYIDYDMLEVMYRKIGNSDLVSVGTYEEYPDGTEHEFYDSFAEGIYEGDSLINIYKSMLYNIENNKLHPFSPWIWNKLYKRKKAKKLFDSISNELVFGEDSLFVCSYLLDSKSVVIYKRCFYHYQYRKESVAHRKDCDILFKINRTYNDFSLLFNNYPKEYNLKQQLDKWLQNNVLRALYFKIGLDDKEARTDLLPQLSFFTVNIYGAGDIGRWLYKYYTGLGIHIASWVDNNYHIITDDMVSAPNRLISNEWPVVIAVGSKELYKGIKKQLLEMHISPNRIVWGLEQVKLLHEELI